MQTCLERPLKPISLRLSREDQVRADLRSGDKITDIPALIRVAIEDAQMVDRSIYMPNASYWYAQFAEGSDEGDPRTCNVCLAGMVLAGTLSVGLVEDLEDLDEDVHFDFEDLPSKHTVNAIRSLDYIRIGLVGEAYKILDVDHTPLMHNKMMLLNMKYRDFYSWDDLDEHLEELSSLADRLDKVHA